VLPRDWATVMPALTRLSIEAGFFGGVAMTLSHDIARDAAALNAIVGRYAAQNPLSSPEEVAAIVRKNLPDEMEKRERDLRFMVRDLSRLMWDASRHYPRAEIQRPFNFRDDLTSEFGRRVVLGLQQREQEQNKAPKT